jgi:hypothetical protein
MSRANHSHLCPVCHKAFNCTGVQCSAYNGVPHLACAPDNRFAKMTRPLPPPTEALHIVFVELEAASEREAFTWVEEAISHHAATAGVSGNVHRLRVYTSDAQHSTLIDSTATEAPDGKP